MPENRKFHLILWTLFENLSRIRGLRHRTPYASMPLISPPFTDIDSIQKPPPGRTTLCKVFQILQDFKGDIISPMLDILNFWLYGRSFIKFFYNFNI